MKLWGGSLANEVGMGSRQIFGFSIKVHEMWGSDAGEGERVARAEEQKRLEVGGV